MPKQGAAIEGTWVRLPDEEGGTRGLERFTFKNGRLSGEQWEQASGRIQYTTDRAVSPMHLDLWVRPVPGVELVRKGIYRIDGDILTACLSTEMGGARPSSFEPSEVGNFELWCMRRVVEDAKARLERDPELLGTWRAKSIQCRGEPHTMPNGDERRIEYVFTDTTLVTGIPRSRGTIEFQYRADKSANPKHLDYWAHRKQYEGGRLAGESTVRFEAIYSVEGTTLTICCDVSHSKRPSEFVSSDEVYWLYVFEKVSETDEHRAGHWSVRDSFRAMFSRVFRSIGRLFGTGGRT